MGKVYQTDASRARIEPLPSARIVSAKTGRRVDDRRQRQIDKEPRLY